MESPDSKNNDDFKVERSPCRSYFRREDPKCCKVFIEPFPNLDCSVLIFRTYFCRRSGMSRPCREPTEYRAHVSLPSRLL